MHQILVVEDQKNLQRSLLQSLQEAGWSCKAAGSLSLATQSLDPSIDLIVLDIMLPDGSGLDWLAQLRASDNRTPVLILTARDAIEDRVAGLDTGADDYLIKPFSLQELIARVRALLRRDERTNTMLLRYSNLTVDLVSRTVTRGNEMLMLQNRQFELLAYLMQHVNSIVTREMIAREVWKESTATWTNVIEVQINQLRKKLEQSGRPAILHTVRGQGYLLGENP